MYGKYKKLTGFPVLDVILKENDDAIFEKKDETAARVIIKRLGLKISEYSSLVNDWCSVLIVGKGNTMDSRTCIRYRCDNMATSPTEDLKKYVSDEVLNALEFFGVIK